MLLVVGMVKTAFLRSPKMRLIRLRQATCDGGSAATKEPLRIKFLCGIRTRVKVEGTMTRIMIRRSEANMS